MIPVRDSFESDFLIINPIEPVSFEYYCGKEYRINQLESMLKDKISVGIVIIDGKDCTIASIINSKILIHKKMSSGLSGKHRSGGQSASRFERLHEEGIHEFHKRIAERVNSIFKEFKIQKLILSGSGNGKNEFINSGLLNNDLIKKIIGVIDIGYNEEQGIRETIQRSEGILNDLDIIKEKEIYNHFFNEILNDSSKAIYGEKIVLEFLSTGQIDTLILSEERFSFINNSEIENNLKKYNTKLDIIGINTDEGYAFLHTFTGIAGILRF